jgi:UDP-glucose 4-epimerase
MNHDPGSGVALTGGSGFIGGHLLAQLLHEGGASVKVLTRKGAPVPVGASAIAGDLGDPAALERLCSGSACIFHCAGYAHAMDGGGRDFAEAHWRINFEGTRNLVEAAGRAGAKKFVHLSTVKAMAEPGNECVDEEWPGEPLSPYGKAKRAAEETVLDAGARYGMHVVNLRLVMVYGPGGKRGNMDRMARLIRRGWFPPLPETGNYRSLVYIDDVVSAMLHVAADPRADGRTYIVAEQAAYSGRQIYELLCQALGFSSAHWAVPALLLRAGGLAGDLAGGLVRRQLPMNTAAVARLLESAWYSAARIERELGWQAGTPLAGGLKRTYAPKAAEHDLRRAGS